MIRESDRQNLLWHDCPIAEQDMAVIEYIIQGSGHAKYASYHNVWFSSVFDGYMAHFAEFSEFESVEAADTGM